MDVYDSILGDFGKYQSINVLLMGCIGITFSWVNFGTKFLTYDVDYWCKKVIHININTTETFYTFAFSDKGIILDFWLQYVFL